MCDLVWEIVRHYLYIGFILGISWFIEDAEDSNYSSWKKFLYSCIFSLPALMLIWPLVLFVSAMEAHEAMIWRRRIKS